MRICYIDGMLYCFLGFYAYKNKRNLFEFYCIRRGKR